MKRKLRLPVHCVGWFALGLFLALETAMAVPPRITARSALVTDHRTGRTLFELDPDRPLPPASTTKILTAYVALRSGRLDERFRVSKHASSMQPSKIWLRPGWQMNGTDLVYAILLNSANDAAVVLAEGVGGSVPGFAQRMNATARAMGAQRSSFVNPSGLPADGHLSTARDLVTIMRASMRSPFLREVLGTSSTVIQPAGSKRKIHLRTHNRLLSDRQFRVLGKTGYTRAARKCFVGVATDGKDEVLVAVLGSGDLWGDLRRLLEYGFEARQDLPSAPAEQHWPAVVEAAVRMPSDPQPLTSLKSRIAKQEATRAEPARVPAAKSLAKHSQAKPASQPRQVAAESPRRPPVATQKAPASRPARVAAGRYDVRVASFRDRVQADTLSQRIRRQGYRPVVERLLTNQRLMFRVTVRGFDSPETAHRAARRLAQQYRLAPQVVRIGA